MLLNVENKRVEIVVSEQLYGSKGFGSLISKLAFEIETGYPSGRDNSLNFWHYIRFKEMSK